MARDSKEMLDEIVTMIFTEGPSEHRRASEERIRMRVRQGWPEIYVEWEKNPGHPVSLSIMLGEGDGNVRVGVAWAPKEIGKFYSPTEALMTIALYEKIARLAEKIENAYPNPLKA
jgi:hypothetical protein